MFDLNSVQLFGLFMLSLGVVIFVGGLFYLNDTEL